MNMPYMDFSKYGTRELTVLLSLSIILLMGVGVSQEPNPFAPQSQAEKGDPFKDCIRIRYDNGKSDGKQSYGGSCPAIQFMMADAGQGGDSIVFKGIRVYCSRYGGGFNPQETYVHVYIIDSKDKLIQKASFPYSILPFDPCWVNLAFKKPVVFEKGEEYLTIVVDPEAHRTKGVYFHYQQNPQTSHSLVASKGSGYKKLEDREWMIRAYFQKGPGGTGAAYTTPVDLNAPPKIVSTIPAMGAANVNPSLSEISVTFDRDMNTGGFSWTGGGPQFPTIPDGKRPKWLNNRTCVLPVKLEPGHKYRVGINAPSFKNFKSARRVPVEPTAIYFTTSGQGQSQGQAAQKPRIINMVPPNGASNVNPNLGEITVSFNVPMGGGFSWTGGGPHFPVIPDGQKPRWSPDKKTCVLPVQLKPNWQYRMGLNSVSFKNFQSQAGVPLEPVVYTFSTGQ